MHISSIIDGSAMHLAIYLLWAHQQQHVKNAQQGYHTNHTVPDVAEN